MNGIDGDKPSQYQPRATRLHHWRMRLLLALTAGCALYSLVFMLSGFPPLRLLVEQAGDVRMQLIADYRTPKPETVPILVLDLDQESYALLGRPTVTPRALMASMLEKVAKGAPRLIILDFDPTWPGGNEAGNQELADTLTRLGRGPVPILLYRTPMAPNVGGATSYFRPSPELDAVVAASSFLMWVSSGVENSADGIIRRAPLWMQGCLGDRPTGLPSASLAGWVILQDRTATAKERLTAALTNTAPHSCTDGAAATAPPPAVTIGGRSYSLRNDWPADTINYSMAAQLTSGLRRDQQSLMVVSARSFIEAPQDIAVELFRDRVVIIGSSAPDLRDLHLTPLGEMSGAMVIANQLRSLQEYGPGDGCGFWFGIMVTMLLSVPTFLLWWLFRWIAPKAPKIVEQLYSMIIGGAIWIALTFLVGSGAALLYPILQYLVILILFAIDPKKHLTEWSEQQEGPR